MKTTTLDHLRTLVANVADPSIPESVRAGHARTLADHAHDLRESVTVAELVLRGTEFFDVLTGNSDRTGQRRALAELRASEFPFTTDTIITDPLATGFQFASPLIRNHAILWTAANGQKPIIPGVMAGGPAEVNPTLPIETGQQFTVDDIAGGTVWDYSTLYFNIARQVRDWIGPDGQALIDATVRDLVDAAAEAFVVDAIETAAGGTAAVGTLADDLDTAEGIAGLNGHGAAWLLIVNPEDWPKVRRQLGSAWGDAPHPDPVVSPGATSGTVTVCGPDAFQLFVADVEMFPSDEAKLFGTGVGVHRPFKLAIRNPDAIRTITGL